MKGIRSNLILHAGAIGDFFLSLPAIAALVGRFPENPTIIACNVRLSSIVTELMRTRFIPIDSTDLSALFIKDGQLSTVRKTLGALEVAVLWLEDTGGVVAANLRELGAKKILGGKGKPPEDGSVHASEFYMSTLRPLKIRAASPGPYLVIPSTLRGITASALLEKGIDVEVHRPIAIHPGSGSERKNWPPAQFARLINHLGEKQRRRLLLLKGYADKRVFRELAPLVDSSGIATLEDEPLLFIAAVLELACCFIGNDSGLGQLAAVLGLPSLTIFGPTDPKVWAPRGHRCVAVQGEKPGDFPPFEKVLEAVERLLAES